MAGFLHQCPLTPRLIWILSASRLEAVPGRRLLWILPWSPPRILTSVSPSANVADPQNPEQAPSFVISPIGHCGLTIIALRSE